MQVRELIEKLRSLPQDAPVVFPGSEIGYHNVETIDLKTMVKFAAGDYDFPNSYLLAKNLSTAEVVVLND